MPPVMLVGEPWTSADRYLGCFVGWERSNVLKRGSKCDGGDELHDEPKLAILLDYVEHRI
jgi:hypothetical protein